MLYRGDCLDVLPTLPSKVDAVVTDPPYGISFMGKDWDHGVPGVAFWKTIGAAMKPGAHLLAFGGTRTFHRLACAIEDAGFEIRDCIMWVYGSGFPKSLNVSKAIDKAAGAKRETTGRTLSITGNRKTGSPAMAKSGLGAVDVGPQAHQETAPATEAAKRWSGWGTALKPAWEPIIVARWPFDGTVAENVQKWGTGALDIDGCRVGTSDNPTALRRKYGFTPNTERAADSEARGALRDRSDPNKKAIPNPSDNLGRWPANLIHDGSDEVTALFPETRGTALKPAWEPIIVARWPFDGTVAENVQKWGTGALNIDGCRVAPTGERLGGGGENPAPFKKAEGWHSPWMENPEKAAAHAAKVSANVDKATQAGRWPANLIHDGSDEVGAKFVESSQGSAARFFYCAKAGKKERGPENTHPTVKPLSLMLYLCKLITPLGGTVLDPFMGSGSTGVACARLGRKFVGVELDPQYFDIARKRIEGETE